MAAEEQDDGCRNAGCCASCDCCIVRCCPTSPIRSNVETMGFMYGTYATPLINLALRSHSFLRSFFQLNITRTTRLIPPSSARVGSTLQFIALLSYLPGLATLAKLDGRCYQGCLNLNGENWYEEPRDRGVPRVLGRWVVHPTDWIHPVPTVPTAEAGDGPSNHSRHTPSLGTTASRRASPPSRCPRVWWRPCDTASEL